MNVNIKSGSRRVRIRIGDIRIIIDVGHAERRKLPAEIAPTTCERDIIDLIRAAGRRVLQPEIMDVLTKADRRERRHGESTVAKSLARMVRDGRLTHVTRRGYGVANPGADE
jgi:hypothetical protein